MKHTFQCKNTAIFLFEMVAEGVKFTFTTLVLKTNYKVVTNFLFYNLRHYLLHKTISTDRLD